MAMSTRRLLARYATLINRFGPDSSRAKSFLDDYSHNSEFVELAELARNLKKALTSPQCKHEEYETSCN